MNRTIYSTLFYLATPLLLIRLLWRSLRAPAYLKRWSERFAFYSGEVKKTDVVFHAVSVGEVHATVPLVEKLLAQYPDLNILVTTSTPTGSARVTALLKNRVGHVYLPYDYPGAMGRFLSYFSPTLFVIMETELWPNLIYHCHRRGISLVLANARLSEKSRNSYARFPALTRQMLLGLDCVTTQSEDDSTRLQSLGLPAERVQVTGSMKYDQSLDPSQMNKAWEMKTALGGRKVLVAASTRTAEGLAEEEQVLSAFHKILENHPDTLLILVPRHPERFSEVYELALKAGFNTLRRSDGHLPDREYQVYLGDSMGEMQYYLGLADVAFVGGSLVPTGCQNVIEPAALGLPIITGPSLYNFAPVSDQLVSAGAQKVVEDADALAETVSALFGNANERKVMGEAAMAAVAKNQGATERNLKVISGFLSVTR